MSGVEFLVLVLLFIFVFSKLKRLVSNSQYLSDNLKGQRHELNQFWLIVFFGYGLRVILQFMYGHYYLVIPKTYTRQMLYYVSNPVMDAPNVIYVYWKHYVAF